jgi:membrane protein DedA with SNARE-associated domain
MEQHIITFIKDLLSTLGYPGVFVAMLIEGSGIPLPSEITMPFAGFLVSIGRFTLIAAILVGTAGEVMGALVGYSIGLFGGRPLLERYGKWAMISPRDIDRGTAWFDRYGVWVVLVGRLLPAVRSYVSIPAGITRMPLVPFLLFSTIGSFVWCTVLTLLGRALGDHWKEISSATRPFEIPVIIALVVLILVYLVLRHFRPRRTPTSTESVVDEPS